MCTALCCRRQQAEIASNFTARSRRTGTPSIEHGCCVEQGAVSDTSSWELPKAKSQVMPMGLPSRHPEAWALQRAGMFCSDRFPAVCGSVPINCAGTESKTMCSQTFAAKPSATRRRGAVGRWAVMQINKRPSKEKKCLCCFFALGPAPKLAPQKSFKQYVHMTLAQCVALCPNNFETEMGGGGLPRQLYRGLCREKRALGRVPQK